MFGIPFGVRLHLLRRHVAAPPACNTHGVLAGGAELPLKLHILHVHQQGAVLQEAVQGPGAHLLIMVAAGTGALATDRAHRGQCLGPHVGPLPRPKDFTTSKAMWVLGFSLLHMI